LNKYKTKTEKVKMETLINYSDSTTPNIERVIDNLTKIDQNTKENLKEI